MTALSIKLNAARSTKAWQLALDKLPFDVQRTDFPRLTRPDGQRREQNIKPHRLNEIIERYRDARGELQSAVERQQQFLASLSIQHGDRFLRVPLVNSSRLLLHLGRASVLENVGLHANRATGLPVIPGSAVKGVVSTWACWEGNLQREEFSESRSSMESHVAQILGSNPAMDRPASDNAGLITFLGAFPSKVPVLELDILTPHPDEGRGRITPNPFLAVKDGTTWDFVLLASSSRGSSCASDLLDCAATWLRDSLTQIGIGAKTANGYGIFRSLTEDESAADQNRFEPIKDEIKAAIQQAAALAEASPEDLAYFAFVNSVTDWISEARDVLTKPDDQRTHIIRFFREEKGQAIIKSWPKNNKAKQRVANLEQAGL